MSTGGLAALVLLLAISTGLVASNPTQDDYGRFILRTATRAAVERGDPTLPARERERLAQLLSSQGQQWVDSLVRPNTTRRDYGFFSLYETRLLDQRIVVLGIGARFVPIRGAEEALHKLGRLVPALVR